MLTFDVLANGAGFTEGPIVTPDGDVAFVSIDQCRLYRHRDGTTEVLADLGGGPNGATEGHDGTIFVAQNGGEWVPGGRVGQRRSREVTGGDGIGFAADGEWLYVARSDANQIVRVPLDGIGRHEPEVSVETELGHPDGFAWGTDGSLLVCAISHRAPGRLFGYDRRGRLVETLCPGPHDRYTNVALDPAGLMYVTDSDGGRVLVADWGVPGLPLYPHRAAS